jgi:hypothetical protein
MNDPRARFRSVGAWLLAGGAAFALSACGGGGSEPRTDAALSDAPGVSLPPPYCTLKPALSSVTDLSGTWVARASGALVTNAPIVGTIRQESILTLLLTLTQQGSQLLVDGRYCNREMKNAPGAVTNVVLPDRWAHTETLTSRAGTYALGPAGFPVVSFPTLTETIGWTAASPADPMPTAPDDPQVFDQDGDGNPGITVLLSGTAISGSMYCTQLQTTAVEAIVVAPDRIEGGLDFTTLQNVLGSDPANLAQLYKAGGTTGPDPTPCSSSFTMVKLPGATGVDGGAAVTCEWVRANQTALFGS